MKFASTLPDKARALASAAIWAAHFGVAYSVAAYACPDGFPVAAAGIGVATLVAAILLLGLLVPAVRGNRRRGSAGWAAAGVPALALAATLWQASALLWRPCA
jgi:hypothetical protein